MFYINVKLIEIYQKKTITQEPLSGCLEALVMI